MPPPARRGPVPNPLLAEPPPPPPPYQQQQHQQQLGGAGGGPVHEDSAEPGPSADDGPTTTTTATITMGASEEIRPLGRCLGSRYGTAPAPAAGPGDTTSTSGGGSPSRRKKSRWGPPVGVGGGGGGAGGGGLAAAAMAAIEMDRLGQAKQAEAEAEAQNEQEAQARDQQSRRSRLRRWDNPGTGTTTSRSSSRSRAAAANGTTSTGLHSDMPSSDLPSCDDRTSEWEAHAEALALGLGLLDDGGEKLSHAQEGRHHGAEATAEEVPATLGAAIMSPPARYEYADHSHSHRHHHHHHNHNHNHNHGGEDGPVVSIGPRMVSSEVEQQQQQQQRQQQQRQQQQRQQQRQNQPQSWAAARRSEHEEKQQQQQQRQGSKSRDGQPEEQAAANDEEQRRWYEQSKWNEGCDTYTSSNAPPPSARPSKVAVEAAAAEAAAAGPLPQRPAPAVSTKGRKRSRPKSASVKFALDGGEEEEPGTATTTTIQLDSTPSSSDLLADSAYIALMCDAASSGEACKSLLASLLDAMGMELPQQSSSSSSSTSSSSSSVYARPMREGRKPVQTPGTVREFALTLITMGLSAGSTSSSSSSSLSSRTPPGEISVLDEVAAAFRLACHHVLHYVAHSSSSSLAASAAASDAAAGAGGGGSKRKKSSKVSDFARRAYMTLFVTLRGLLVLIVDRADSDEEQQPSPLRTFFDRNAVDASLTDDSSKGGGVAASVSLSMAESLLLDVVPLLTRFAHPPLGDKHSKSLLSNLLLLDESTRAKKRDAKAGVMIVQDGLMELFLRQLVEQEGLGQKKLRKLLNVPSAEKAGGGEGAAAALLPKPSDDCLNMSNAINEHRGRQKVELERKRDQEAIVNAADIAKSVSSSSWECKDVSSFMDRELKASKIDIDGVDCVSSADIDDDLRLVRIDGCIYLSKVARTMMESRPKPLRPAASSGGAAVANRAKEKGKSTSTCTSNGSELASSNYAASAELKNQVYERERDQDDKLRQRLDRVAQTAYFLFHTLVESNAVPNWDGSNGDRRLRRKDVSSAVLSCYMLAGKMEDCPFKLKTILRITKNSSLPPPPLETIRQCYKKLAPNNAEVLPMKWGEPSIDLIKQYELNLLSTLGFIIPQHSQNMHPITSLNEMEIKLALDANAIKHLQDLMNGPCYTHSSLCLLREPQLMAAALYYLSCERGRSPLLGNWDLVLEEEAVVVKVVADYAWWVKKCVKAREQQWNSFKMLKYKVDPEHASSKGSTDHIDDELAVWSRTIPPISAFECPPPLPVELSAVTEKINSILSASDDDESKSSNEVKDEDYLTLAALLEIPDNAVESDQSPSSNSVDSIAVLMNTHARGTDEADNSGCASDRDGNRSVIVSPSSGDTRRESYSSANSISMENAIKFDERESPANKSSQADASGSNTVKDRVDNDVARSHAKSEPPAPSAAGNGQSIKPSAKSNAATKSQMPNEGSERTKPPLGRGASKSNTAKAQAQPINAGTESARPLSASGAIVTSAIPISPIIRRKNTPAKPAGSKSNGKGRKRRTEPEMPALLKVAKATESDTPLNKSLKPRAQETHSSRAPSSTIDVTGATEEKWPGRKLKAAAKVTKLDIAPKPNESPVEPAKATKKDIVTKPKENRGAPPAKIMKRDTLSKSKEYPKVSSVKDTKKDMLSKPKDNPGVSTTKKHAPLEPKESPGVPRGKDTLSKPRAMPDCITTDEKSFCQELEEKIPKATEKDNLWKNGTKSSAPANSPNMPSTDDTSKAMETGTQMPKAKKVAPVAESKAMEMDSHAPLKKRRLKSAAPEVSVDTLLTSDVSASSATKNASGRKPLKRKSEEAPASVPKETKVSKTTAKFPSVKTSVKDPEVGTVSPRPASSSLGDKAAAFAKIATIESIPFKSPRKAVASSLTASKPISSKPPKKPAPSALSEAKIASKSVATKITENFAPPKLDAIKTSKKAASFPKEPKVASKSAATKIHYDLTNSNAELAKPSASNAPKEASTSSPEVSKPVAVKSDKKMASPNEGQASIKKISKVAPKTVAAKSPKKLIASATQKQDTCLVIASLASSSLSDSQAVQPDIAAGVRETPAWYPVPDLRRLEQQAKAQELKTTASPTNASPASTSKRPDPTTTVDPDETTDAAMGESQAKAATSVRRKKGRPKKKNAKAQRAPSKCPGTKEQQGIKGDKTLEQASCSSVSKPVEENKTNQAVKHTSDVSDLKKAEDSKASKSTEHASDVSGLKPAKREGKDEESKSTDNAAPATPSQAIQEIILIDIDDDSDDDAADGRVKSGAVSQSKIQGVHVKTTPNKKAEGEEKRRDTRPLFDFSSQTMNKTKPLYNSASRPLEDKEGMHLCCELGCLTRENATHFIDAMKKKPDEFWLDKDVVSKAQQAFQFQLPPRVLSEDARHLFRNFADSVDPVVCSCTGPKRLAISRREMDIMLYFSSKGKSARDCHYLMPYRSQRGLRRVFETIKSLDGVEDVYMSNVTSTVEKVTAIEGPGKNEERAPCIQSL